MSRPDDNVEMNWQGVLVAARLHAMRRAQGIQETVSVFADPEGTVNRRAYVRSNSEGWPEGAKLIGEARNGMNFTWFGRPS